MEGFLQHVAPQFLHPALQTFGCGAFRPIAGAFHPLYPAKAFSRHFTDQYSLSQAFGVSQRQPLFGIGESSDDASGRANSCAREGSSSPGSAASASPGPRNKEEEPLPCAEDHDFLKSSHKLRCGVCGARLGPGVAQAHFVQELQHLYSLSAPPREPAPSHHDEDARWETYQRIKANRQRRLRQKSRKRHSVESLLYDDLERLREPEMRCEEDEPVDVEGDSMGWPEGALTAPTEVLEKEHITDVDNLERVPMTYSEDLEISSTNDGVQSPQHSVRGATPETPGSAASAGLGASGSAASAGLATAGSAADCVSTSVEAYRGEAPAWAYLKAAAGRVAKPEEQNNQPSSTDPHNN